MLRKLYCTFLLLILIPTQRLLSQNSGINFERLGIKEGLLSKEVQFITKDAQGFLWLGFKQSISRYDGYHFTHFPQSEMLFGLSSDHKGKIWFANINGLFSIDEKSLKIQKEISSDLHDAYPENDHYENVFADSQGQIWSNDFNNIKCFEPKTKHLKVFRITSSYQFNIFKSRFTEDSQGRVWVANQWGIQCYDSQTKRLWKVLKNQSVSDIAFLSKDSTLFTTANGGVFLLEISKKHISSYVKLPSKTDVSVFLKPAHLPSHFWLGTDRSLYLFDAQQRAFVDFSNLREEGIAMKDCYLDTQNQIIWLASSVGLLKHDFAVDATLLQVDLPKKLVAFPVKVTCFFHENTERNWLGLSHTGVLSWNEHTNDFQLFAIPDGAPVNQLLEDASGNLLACTQKAIFRLNLAKKSWEKLISFSTNIKKVCLTRQNQLWCLPESGAIQVYDWRTHQRLQPWKELPYQNFFQQNVFTDILETTDGNLWFSAWFPKGFGIAHFDIKMKQFVLAENQNKHTDFVTDYYLSLAYHEPNTIAISGYGGFNVLNTTTGKIIRTGASGNLKLKGGNCNSIVLDKKGTIWMGTTEGVCSVGKQNQVSYFSEKDGLTENDVVYGYSLNQANQLWLGFTNQFNILQLERLQQKQIKSNLKISTIEILGDTTLVNTHESLVFEPQQNNLTIRLSPLNFKSASQNHIRFKLVDIHDNWIDNGNAEMISFSNLAPKQYELLVQQGDSQGNWASIPLSIDFEIQPHFYQTWWFQLLVGLLVLIAVYSLYLYRIKQIKEIYTVRNRISADLHDEVGSTISGINIISNILKQRLVEQPENKGFVERISEDAKKISEALDDIVWSIKPQNDSLENVLSRMTRYASELFEAKNINYQLQLPEDLSGIALPMEKRHDIYLIFKETVNNIAKHSQCSEASIKIMIQKKSIILSIQDNGIGFDPDQKTDRNGIQNIKERVNKYQGKLSIQSDPMSGSLFLIDLPI